MLQRDPSSSCSELRPTKRAPDAGNSAHIPSSFLRQSIFWLDGFAVPAPAQETHAVRQQVQTEGEPAILNLRSVAQQPSKYCYFRSFYHGYR